MSRTKRASVMLAVLGAVAAGAWVVRAVRVTEDRNRSRTAVVGILWNLGTYSELNNRLPPH
jgi:hypothetical protein